MPRTFWTFLAGAAALSGLPLMSGFFSKDEILAHAFAHGGLSYLFWGVGVLTAGVTAYYTWRMVALTFFGSERFDAHHVHPHESPALMTAPLAVLAVLSIGGGVLGLPHVLFGAPHLLGTWLAPVLERGQRILAQHGELPHLSAGMEWLLLGVGAAVALLFAHDGFHAYRRGPERDLATEKGSPEAAGFLKEAWRIDAGYGSMIVLPLRMAAFVIAVVVDQFAIDGLVNGAGALARDLGGRLRRTASGDLGGYALWMGAGAVLISLAWMWS